MTSYNPKIVYPHEIFLKESIFINIKHNQLYHHSKNDGNRASEGVSILVRKDILQHQIHMDNDLQTIALEATLHELIIIYSICILPHDSISDTKINKLLEQIPKPHLLQDYLTATALYEGARKPAEKQGSWESDQY